MALAALIFTSVALDSVTAVQYYRKPLEKDSDADPSKDLMHVKYPQKNYTVECFGKNKTFPEDMVLINRKVMWCPNAKVGTTTVFGHMQKLFGVDYEIRCDSYTPCQYEGVVENVRYAPVDAVCSASTYSFIRNPWDRMISVYVDKIVTGRVDPWVETPLHPERAVQYHPVGTPSFPQFLRFISKQSAEEMNGHWAPYSDRCLTSGENAFNYDHIHKLEGKFDERVSEMFEKAGFSLKNVEGVKSTNHSLTEHTVDARIGFYENNTDDASTKWDLVKIVRDMFKDDIALGEYTFENYNMPE